MPFKVTYSGLNTNTAPKSPWANVIPYVSVDNSKNWTSNRLFDEQSVSLKGVLTESGFNALGSNPTGYGYPASPSPITNLLYPTGYIKIMRDVFSGCYGELVATDEANKSILSGIFYVDSINFDAQNYIGLIDYSIDLKRFNNLKYSGIEPSETINISEDGNGIVNINHTISAAGVGPAFDGNNSIAFDSVKTFVQNSTGVNRIKSLTFGSGYIPTGQGASGVYVAGDGVGINHSSNFILISQIESINRLENSYSISESFVVDNLRNGQYGTKRFSVDLNSGIANDYILANVSCDIVGAKDKSFSDVSGMLANITGEMYSAATGIVNNETLLCKTPISFSIDTTRLITGHVNGSNITSVDGNSTISVTCGFDNSSESTFFDYEVSFSTDEVSNVTNIDIDGIIKGRGLHTAQRFADASGYLFNDLLDGENPDVKTLLFNKATGVFQKIAPTSSNPSFGIIGENYNNGSGFGFVKDKGRVSLQMNSGKGEISLSASFSDDTAVSGYERFGWEVSSDVGLPILVIKPSLSVNGFNIIQEIGVKQKTDYSFNGTFGFVSGAFGSIPILNQAYQPHTGILKKLIEAEGFPDLAYSKAYTEEDVNLGSYTKNFDFVSGTASTSSDYLASGFDLSISKPDQDSLKIYSTYSVQ